jgi:hypothetical protein
MENPSNKPNNETHHDVVESTERHSKGTLRQTAAQWRQRAQRAIDESRGSTAGVMGSAASKLHHTADEFSNWANQLASSIESGADYIRRHDSREMFLDFERLVRRHPGKSLLIALALGFWTARMVRHD